MTEKKLIDHMLNLYVISKAYGLLDLEHYDSSSNKFIKNKLYYYCLRSLLDCNYEQIYEFIKIDRTKTEMIIIEGFNFILNNGKDKDFYEKVENYRKMNNLLRSLMRDPKIFNDSYSIELENKILLQHKKYRSHCKIDQI